MKHRTAEAWFQGVILNGVKRILGVRTLLCEEDIYYLLERIQARVRFGALKPRVGDRINWGRGNGGLWRPHCYKDIKGKERLCGYSSSKVIAITDEEITFECLECGFTERHSLRSLSDEPWNYIKAGAWI